MGIPIDQTADLGDILSVDGLHLLYIVGETQVVVFSLEAGVEHCVKLEVKVVGHVQ